MNPPNCSCEVCIYYNSKIKQLEREILELRQQIARLARDYEALNYQYHELILPDLLRDVNEEFKHPRVIFPDPPRHPGWDD